MNCGFRVHCVFSYTALIKAGMMGKGDKKETRG